MNIYPFEIVQINDWCLFVCLFVFYDKSNIVGYLRPNLFYTNKQFYFKQFSLA